MKFHASAAPTAHLVCVRSLRNNRQTHVAFSYARIRGLCAVRGKGHSLRHSFLRLTPLMMEK